MGWFSFRGKPRKVSKAQSSPKPPAQLHLATALLFDRPSPISRLPLDRPRRRDFLGPRR